MIKRRLAQTIVAVAGLVAVVVLAGPASASPAHVRVDNKTVRLGSCRSSGDFATCIASGSVNNPLYIRAHVDASPNQSETGNWNMVCSKGTSAGSTSGTISGHTPRVKRLRMPFSNPDSCDVAVSGGLNGNGSIFVYITARVP
jgi:hypothetical protein